MRMLILLSCLLPILAACQAKGEKRAPCAPISGYAEADLCGPVHSVNDGFDAILAE